QPGGGRVQVAQALDAQPRVVGLDRERARVLERGELFGEPVQAPEASELLLQSRGQRQQVAYVIERVLDLRGRQRAARPVGARVGLGELPSQESAHGFRVADLGRQAGESGGDLGVEHRPHQARERQQHLQDLPASTLLLALTVSAYLGVNLVVSSVLPPVKSWPAQVLVDTLFTLAWYVALLKLAGRSERILQTATAVFGLQGLLSPLLIASDWLMLRL